MSAPLVFMDTETTGLAIDDDIWEFAAIRRDPDGTEVEYHAFVDHDFGRCSHLPISFRDDHYDRYLQHRSISVPEFVTLVQDIFRNGKPHVVGAVPNFDTERIAHLCRALKRGIPKWHYHLIDVENLAVGYLAATLGTFAPPWDSNGLSAAVGVDPDQFERHTAMGDVRWAMAIYDVVTGRTS